MLNTYAYLSSYKLKIVNNAGLASVNYQRNHCVIDLNLFVHWWKVVFQSRVFNVLAKSVLILNKPSLD